MLAVRGLSRPGLGPVNFDLAAGECLAVMGPSGGGKTLLLRALADLDPNDGEVRLDGAERHAMPAPYWRRRVMYLAAEPGWWADRVAEHFTDSEKAAALIERLGLPARALGWTVARLSTGERQRLALARVLIHEPDVLLLDEPTAALDPAARKRVEALLRERLAAGTAMLLTTHDLRQARRLAKRCLKVTDGNVREATL